jgi:hypothetical protein
VPFHAEVGVEPVGEAEPWDLPSHPFLQPRNVRLRRTRDEDEGGVTGIEVCDVGDLVGDHGAAAAGVLGPAEHTRLEEGAIDDQLMPTVEQVQQAGLSSGPVEGIGLLHCHPRHPPTLGGQRVASPRLCLFLHEQFLVGGLPLLRRHDRWGVHGGLPARASALVRLGSHG